MLAPRLKQITGSAGANVLKGGASQDTLIGGGGNDSLYGDNDGAVASYSYLTGTPAVTVNLIDTESASVNAAAADVDQLYSMTGVSGSNGSDLFTMTFSGGAASASGYVLDAGNNTTGAGDTLDYAAWTMDGVIYDFSATNGYVQASGFTQTLRGFERLLAGTGNDTIYADTADAAANNLYNPGTGSDDLVSYENVVATALSVTLDTGTVGSATVQGLGADTLVGADSIYGGGGSDTLVLGLALVAPTSHAGPPAKAADKPGDKVSAKDRILGALELPRKAHALRKAGVDEPSVKAGLKAAKDRQLHAKDAADLLDAAGKAVKDHGPVDNFGAFVQTQLDAGLRGKDLADAIRQEHETRGKGKDGKGKSGDKAKPDEKGADAANPDAANPDAKGNDAKGDDGLESKGPPDGKGPDDQGQARGRRRGRSRRQERRRQERRRQERRQGP